MIRRMSKLRNDCQSFASCSRSLWQQGGHPPRKPGKVRKFDIGQRNVGEFRISQGNGGLRVVSYCICDSHKINIFYTLSTVK